jgi:mono/diheme cytochrome c family protein
MRFLFYCSFILSSAPWAFAEDAAALWRNKVQLVLDQNCVKCHGPLEQEAELQLDTPEAVLHGSEYGLVVRPGRPDASPLIKHLAAGADPHMPPKKQLPDADIAVLRQWVTALGEATPAPAQSTAGAAEFHSIDGILQADWKAAGITPAPLTDDRTFLRRVSLDLVGRIPTVVETNEFLANASPDKRTVLVDQLLATDEAARNFREVWDALLLGRRNGRREDKRRDNGWFAFLETSFKNSRPWTEVVSAMIEARPQKPEDKGSMWFLFEQKNEHQQIAEAIAPVIYGTRIDCAQCHDHPLAREIKQGHYWGLVAAFNRSKNSDKGPPVVTESAVGGFINFTNLKKESQPAILCMLTGKTIDESRPDPTAKEEDGNERYLDPKAAVKVPKFSRRSALAKEATTDNPLLARSFVNHAWALMMGRGIVHPVDEMNSKNPPSHPVLLDWLAQDFAKHGYDVRRVIRNIALSSAYQLGRSATVLPPDSFASALERPLTAEAMARSACIATGQSPADEKLRRTMVETFPDILPRVTRATIQQAMFLANSDTFSAVFAPSPGLEPLARIPAYDERARQIFRQALLRDPEADELQRAVEYLQSRPDHAIEAIGQLLWSLASGPEFLTNH